MTNQEFQFPRGKILFAICIYFSLTFCVNTAPTTETGNGKGVVEQEANGMNGKENFPNETETPQSTTDEELPSPFARFTPSSSFSSSTLSNTQTDEGTPSPTHVETPTSDDFENNVENVNIQNEIVGEMSAGDVENDDNEEIMKPLNYALKQIYIVLSSFLDENSLKLILEGKQPQNSENELIEASASENDNNAKAPIDETEAIVAESSKANEVQPSNGVSSPTKETENEKLMKVLDKLKEGSVDSICLQQHTVHQEGIFELLKHYVKNMIENNQTVETLIEKINLLINKIGGGGKNRLKNHFAAVLHRFGSRNLQIKLHYIQDIQKHGKKIIEDKKGKLYFFLFLNFWQISNSLREGVEIIFKNPVPKGHLLFNNFENENNRKQLLVQQLEIADCLMNKLVMKLENVLLKPILEKNNVELLKQAVRMSIAPFVKQQHFVLNAFGLQQNLENVCDVNYIHKNPLKLFNEITKKAKNLEEVKNKIFGSILGAFYYIGAELGSNYLNLIKILNESMKLTEEESKNSKIPMKIQINHLFGHFYSQLLTKYGGELEETNFSKWLNKVKEMFLKKPKIVKKKITEPVDDNVRFPELE